MIGDFFTKPLQGALFHCMKQVILGQGSIKEFTDTHENKEHVGKAYFSRVVNKKVSKNFGKEKEEVEDIAN